MPLTMRAVLLPMPCTRIVGSREIVQLSRVVGAARETVNTRWAPPPGITMADMDLINAVVEAQ